MANNPDSHFVRVHETQQPYLGLIEMPRVCEEFIPFTPDEEHWSLAGLEMPAMLEGASDGVAEVKKPKRKSNWKPKALDAAPLTPPA